MIAVRQFVALVAGAALLLAGCGRPGPAAKREPVVEIARVRLQLDWLPQIESGGYYLAEARGYYRAHGLQVEILPGGPGLAVREVVGKGNADLGATDGNGVLVSVAAGLPLVIVGAEMQRSPQGLLFHRTHPLRSFRDLDGRTVIASANMAWVEFLQRSFRVRFALRPNNTDLTAFVADETLVRQCFVTQEPYLAERGGAQVGFLMLADAGYDPYRVIFCRREYAAAHPDMVRRFLIATIAGYEELLRGDPSPAFTAIAAANPTMPREVMEHGLARMRELHLVDGRVSEGERTGRIVRDRIAGQIDQLQRLKLLERNVEVDEVARFDLLPVAGMPDPTQPQTP